MEMMVGFFEEKRTGGLFFYCFPFFSILLGDEGWALIERGTWVKSSEAKLEFLIQHYHTKILAVLK